MGVVEFFLSGVCHQWPDHSIHFGGRPLPLCARCMGTFLGVVIALVVLRIIGQGRRSALPSSRLWLILGGLVGVWVLDGVNSVYHWLMGTLLLYEPTNALRLVTGMASGLALGVVLYPLHHYAMWRQVDPRPVLDRQWQIVGPLAAGAATVATILFWRSAPYALWALLVSMSVAAVLALVNAQLIVLLRRGEGFADRGVRIVPYLALGFVAALGETGGLALLRRLLGSY